MKKFKKIIDNELFTFEQETIQREYGKTPNENDLNGKWVYRINDKFIDFDMYINDLAERNNIKVLY